MAPLLGIEPRSQAGTMLSAFHTTNSPLSLLACNKLIYIKAKNLSISKSISISISIYPYIIDKDKMIDIYIHIYKIIIINLIISGRKPWKH